MKAIKCANIVRSIHKSKYNLQKNMTVLVNQEGRITDIVPSNQMDMNSITEVIDFNDENVFVLPGLIDCHVHLAHNGTNISQKYEPDSMVALRMAHNAKINLQTGVTSLRDMGAKNHIDVIFKEALKQQLVTAPRMFNSGKPIITTGGHCSYMGRAADGPHEIRKAVREQIEVKVDFVKLMITGGIMTEETDIKTMQMNEEEMISAIETAHDAGVKVAAHAQGGQGVLLALKYGVDTLEHGIMLNQKEVSLLKDKSIHYIPTLIAIKEIADKGVEYGLPEWAISKSKVLTDKHRLSFQLALENDISIGTGTDFKHGILLDEIKIMLEYGATINEVLFFATMNAAEIINQEKDVGTLEKSKFADMIVVKGNPFDDINNLQKIERVLISGDVKC